MKNNPFPIILHSHSDQLRSPDCDCDCACENSLHSYPADMVLEGDWVTAKHARPISTDCGWTTIYNPSGPVAVSVVNEAGLRLWQSFDQPRKIAELKTVYMETARSMAEIGLLYQQDHFAPIIMDVPKTLSAWLHITNICNLRCDYCYLHKTSDDMSQEVAFASLNALFDSAQKHNYQVVKIKYAGGEPFIRFDLLREMHFEAKRLKEKYLVDLEEVIISNGTLIKECDIDFLINEDIRLSISLDGLGVTHDQQRPHVNGKGSFAEIERNLMLCKKKGFRPDITITVTDRNSMQLAEISTFLLKSGFHFNFNFYRENDCAISHQDLKFSEEKMIEGIKSAYKVIEENLPDWSLLGALADRSSFVAPHTHTCSVGWDYMVIDHHGQVAKCQMTIGIPITNIYSSDPLMDIRNDKLGIQNISVDEKEGCKICEWKNWCTGGCSLATYRATGRYDVKSPNCNIYKAIYPELLKLESLRLVKYYGG